MFIKQALLGKHEWWRYVVGFVVIMLGWQLIGVIPLLAIVAVKGIKGGSNIEIAHALGTNTFLCFLIFSFGVGLLTIYFWVTYVHKLPFKKVITTRKKLDWKRIFTGFFAIVLVNFVMQLISYLLTPEKFEYNFNLEAFAVLFAVVLFLPIQTTFEEVLFRGYLMQGLGVNSKFKGVAFILTSVMFGLMHLGNPEVDKFGYLIMVYYIGTGITLAIFTLMDEGMELSLGFHAGNNMFAALFITADYSAIQTDSIFRDISDPTLGFEVLFPILVEVIIIFIFAKKYKWNNWKEKLFGSVSSYESIN